MPKFLTARGAIAACAASCACLPAAAETVNAATNGPAGPAASLPPIVVEASRVGKSAADMPADVQVITAREIAGSGCQSAAELLEKRANLLVRKMNANPASGQIAARGFGENSFGRVLIFVDGERLNNPDMSAPNLARIPLDSIARVEILSGPQTVLHGDSAVAGVVNIITAGAAGGDPYAPSTTLSGSAGSFETFRAHLARSGGWEGERVSYRASLDWEDSDGYRENGGYDVWNLNAAVRREWENGSRVSLSAFYNNSEYEMPGALTRRQYMSARSPRAAQTPDDRARLYSYGMNLGGAGALPDGRSLEANLTASRRNSFWDSVSLGSDLEYDVYAYAFTPRYIDRSDLFGRESRLIAGADLRWETLDYLAKAGPAAGRLRTGRDYGRFSAAAYAQEEWFLTDDVSVTLGARGERFHSRWQPDQAGRANWADDEFACEAAVNCRPAEGVKLFLRGGRFYRAPFCDEMNYAPKTLRPETGYAAELGADGRISREWSARASVYSMWMEDEIFLDPGAPYLGWWGANVNSPARTRRAGADAALFWSREGVGSAGLLYRCVDARFTDGRYEECRAPLAPRHLLRLNGELCLTGELTLFGGCRWVSDQVLAGDYANAKERLKAYGLLDGGLRYAPGRLGGRLTLQLAADNLLGKKYCDFAGVAGGAPYYYPAAGRVFTFTAAYTF